MPKQFYVLCGNSPCAKKTPHIYELENHICPCCGERLRGLVLGVGYRNSPGHRVSSDPDYLLDLKQGIIAGRAEAREAMKKGATNE